MKCNVCGVTVYRTIDHMCVDCYLDNNQPSEVQNRSWVYASSFELSKNIGESQSSELAGAIFSDQVRIDEEKSGFVIPLDDEELIVPFDVDAVDELAARARKVGFQALIMLVN